MKKVPEIRFAGFAEPWEQRKLGEITDMYSGGTPTVGNKEYYNGDIPFIRSGEISSYKTELFITKEGLNNSSAKMIAEGDILYALYGATSGEVSISNLKGAINQAILAIKPHQNYDSQFLMQWLRKSKESIISAYLQGGQGNLSGNIIKHLIIDLPSFDEQRYIGCYFKKIDNLLTLHQRKLDKLVVLKQAMLEKMLPQNGSNVPEIRFAGFTDPWGQRKFEDIAVRSSTISSESGLPRVEYEDIISGTGRLNKDIFAKESNKTGIVFHRGDVLYGKLRPYLQNWLLPSFNGLAVGDFWVLQPQNADSSFLYRLIQSRQFDEVANQSTGTKMPRADWRLVSKTEFFIPNTIDEQTAIGTFFEQIDSLITLQQHKYETLKRVKAALLQKMFV